MIAEGHDSGYSIKTEIDRSVRLYWPAPVGSIYPQLHRLLRDRLITVRDDPRGAIERRSYGLTPTGQQVLHAWLIDSSEPFLQLRNEALLRLRFAATLTPAEQRELLDRMHDQHQQNVDALTDRIGGSNLDDPFARMTVAFMLGCNQWARDWCASHRSRGL